MTTEALIKDLLAWGAKQKRAKEAENPGGAKSCRDPSRVRSEQRRHLKVPENILLSSTPPQSGDITVLLFRFDLLPYEWT
ncbi:hypothetical protein L596_008171 [Steinernema carpocapsae]|uniref:Uncharacterized protein n=1 Tax=Steinernema carpocapsae TaxID=34508 RepID=A0A4U5PCP9_STECR|nr:hypothetical protein L596_008171 [Steinernema carpocapsae]